MVSFSKFWKIGAFRGKITRNGYLFSENYPWKYGPYEFWPGIHQYTTDQTKSEYPSLGL